MKFHFKYQQEKKGTQLRPKIKEQWAAEEVIKAKPRRGSQNRKGAEVQMRPKSQKQRRKYLWIRHASMHAKLLQSDSVRRYGLYSPPGSSVHDILQARILEWVAISSSKGSPWPRDWIFIFWYHCIGRLILRHWATWLCVFFFSVAFLKLLKSPTNKACTRSRQPLLTL